MKRLAIKLLLNVAFNVILKQAKKCSVKTKNTIDDDLIREIEKIKGDLFKLV